MSPLKTLLISTLTITGFGVAACSGNTVQAPDETAVEAINVAKSLGDVIAHPRRADDMARKFGPVGIRKSLRLISQRMVELM